MDNIKLGQYKGYEIIVRPNTGEFQGKLENTYVGWFSTLEELRNKIDRLISSGRKINPEPAFYIKNYGEVVRGKVTSVNLEEREIWFTNEKGSREKSRAVYTTVYQLTPENEELIKEFSALNEQENELTKRIETIKSQFSNPVIPKK